MIQRWVAIALVPALAAAAAGCRARQEYWVNPDGSGKVAYTLSMEHNTRFPTEQLETMRKAYEVLNNSKGVEAWSDISYESKDGRIHIRATGYFPDISQVRPQHGSQFQVLWHRAKGAATLRMQARGMSAPKAPVKLTEEQLAARIKEIRRQAAAPVTGPAKTYIEAMSNSSTQYVFHLPGRIVDCTNLTRDKAGTVSLELDGAKVEKAYRDITASDKDMREILLAGEMASDEGGRPKGGPVYVRKVCRRLYGRESLPVVRLGGDLKPLFDYTSAVTAAKKGYEQSLIEAGLMPKDLAAAKGLRFKQIKVLRTSLSVSPRGKKTLFIHCKATMPRQAFRSFGGIAYRAVDGDGKRLLPQPGRWNRLQIRTVGKGPYSFTIDLPVKGQAPQELDEIFGELWFAAGGSVKGGDLGFDELKAGAKGKRYDAEIVSVRQHEVRGVRMTTVVLTAKFPPKSIYGNFSVRGEDGTGPRGPESSSIRTKDGVTSVTRTFCGELPAKGKISASVRENVQPFRVPFRLTNVKVDLPKPDTTKRKPAPPGPSLLPDNLALIGATVLDAQKKNGRVEGTLRVGRTYCGRKITQGRWFRAVSSTSPQSSTGTDLYPPLKPREEGIWLVKATEAGDKITPLRQHRWGVYWPARKGASARFVQAKALAEALREVSRASVAGRPKLLDRFAADETPEVSAAAVRIIAETADNKVEILRRMLKAGKVKPAGLMVLDEVLESADAGWAQSAARLAMFRKTIDSEVSQYEAERVLDRISVSWQLKKMTDLSTRSLSRAAAYTISFPFKARQDALRHLGWMAVQAHRNMRDNSANVSAMSFYVLAAAVGELEDERLRVSAAGALGIVPSSPERLVGMRLLIGRAESAPLKKALDAAMRQQKQRVPQCFAPLGHDDERGMARIRKTLEAQEWFGRVADGEQYVVLAFDGRALLPTNLRVGVETVKSSVPTYRVRCGRDAGKKLPNAFLVAVCSSPAQARELLFRYTTVIATPQPYLMKGWKPDAPAYGDVALGPNLWTRGNLRLRVEDGQLQRAFWKTVFGGIDARIRQEPEVRKTIEGLTWRVARLPGQDVWRVDVTEWPAECLVILVAEGASATVITGGRGVLLERTAADPKAAETGAPRARWLVVPRGDKPALAAPVRLRTREPAAALAGRVIAYTRTGDADVTWRLDGRVDVLGELAKLLPTLDERTQKGVVLAALNVAPDSGRRYTLSAPVTKFLVDVAVGAKSRDVRNRAEDLLVRRVPGSYLQPHAEAIIAAARAGKIDSALLLGKSGTVEAMALLKKGSRIRKQYEPSARWALARLGDVAMRREFLQAFQTETDADKKARLARSLGYIGDRACAVALAAEMRSPVVYISGGCHKAFRVDVMEALSEVYPTNRLFWRQDSPDETWYANAERWLHANLGVTWKAARPPFHYVYSIPHPPPG